MNITRLELSCFRNHLKTDVHWARRINVITGSNGAGKTNLLDAIHYLCMSRSFVASTDQYVVAAGEKKFQIEGTFEGSIRSKFKVGCSYARGEGKKITVNESPLDKLPDLIGRVPVVVLSPDDKRLTSEGPAERRSFLDAFISQLSPAYLRDLIDYRKVLRQRNSLLSDARVSGNTLRTLIEPWDAQLLRTGSKIIDQRAQVLSRFCGFLEESYQKIAGIGHYPRFEYKTLCENTHSVEEVEQAYTQLLSEVFEKDCERQQTTVGPHRDDIVFYLDNKELRKFGSQGQHRLFALALKLAQRAYYEDELEDLPIFLLDDVFGDLDPGKIKVLLEMFLNQPGQTFITAANKTLFTELIKPKKGLHHFYKIADGVIQCETDKDSVKLSEISEHKTEYLSDDATNPIDSDELSSEGVSEDTNDISMVDETFSELEINSKAASAKKDNGSNPNSAESEEQAKQKVT